MNLRQIDTFREVILRGSMTAAADRLHTSQPSISRVIADLEADTGLKLFTRHAGRVVPTDAGMAFFREVEHSYRGLDSLAQSAKEIRLLGTGRIRLAAIPAMATTLVPHVIRQFKEEYPDVAVSLEMRSESTVARWASAAYCDIGFASMLPDSYGVSIEKIYDFAGVCAVPQSHPWARRKRITVKDLAQERLIIPSPADITRHQIDAVLQTARIDKLPTIETPYGATVCALVAEGLGVGIVNPLIGAHRPPEGVTFVPFTPTIKYRGYIVTPEGNRNDLLTNRFVAATRHALATRYAGLANGSRQDSNLS